jgi:hypothetical protein
MVRAFSSSECDAIAQFDEESVTCQRSKFSPLRTIFIPRTLTRTMGITQKEVVVSKTLADGRMIELVYSRIEATTQFAVFDNKDIEYKETVDDEFIPVSAKNNLLKHNALMLPEKAEDFDSVSALVKNIEDYIYQYVDVSDHFRKIATYYVLLTWVYDAFNELPYLRLRGDYGSGKTRALFVIGSVCNKAFFASGASTVSPIFHTLDTFRGTLVFDEADFRFSDEKSELVKIFNNGNVRGFPVLRTALTPKREFDPQAFVVFGPKVVAMRKSFDDPALESRFLTEEMGQRTMRADIPINLPERQKDEALALRNKLLMYRFKTLSSIKVNDTLIDPMLSPRMNQILMPLLSIIDDEKLRSEIRTTVRAFDKRLVGDRSLSLEAVILRVLHGLIMADTETSIPLGTLTTQVNTVSLEDLDQPLTVRVVGTVLRKRLRIFPQKSHGVYVLPQSELLKVQELCFRYGVTDREVSIEEGSGRLGDLIQG